jgi:hypothetical protein
MLKGIVSQIKSLNNGQLISPVIFISASPYEPTTYFTSQ